MFMYSSLINKSISLHPIIYRSEINVQYKKLLGHEIGFSIDSFRLRAYGDVYSGRGMSRRGEWVVSVLVSGSVGRRFKSRRRHELSFRRVITPSKWFTCIYSVSSTEDFKLSVWHCRYCNVSGQNKRLYIECRFQDRYINAIIIIYYYLFQYWAQSFHMPNGDSLQQAG